MKCSLNRNKIWLLILSHVNDIGANFEHFNSEKQIIFSARFQAHMDLSCL